MPAFPTSRTIERLLPGSNLGSALPTTDPGSGRPWLHSSGALVVGPYAGVTGAIDWANIANKPTLFPPEVHVHSAADILAGTLNDDRLSANIPRLNAANTFTQLQTARCFIGATQSGGPFTGGFDLVGVDSGRFINTPAGGLLNISNRFAISSGGFYASVVGANALLGFSTSTTLAPDVAFSRVSPGVAQLGTTGANALGSLNLANLTASILVRGNALSAFGSNPSLTIDDNGSASVPSIVFRNGSGSSATRAELRGGAGLANRLDLVFGGHVASFGAGNTSEVAFPGNIQFASGSGNTLSTAAGSLTLAPFDGQIRFGSVGAASMQVASNTIRLRANNGVFVRNATDSADMPIFVSNVNASGNINAADTGRIQTYSTADQTTNFGRGVIRGVPSGLALHVQVYDVERGGTVTGAWHSFRVNGVTRMEIDSNNLILHSQVLSSTDNTFDIGRLSGTPLRFRNGFFGTGLQAGAPANTPIAGSIHGYASSAAGLASVFQGSTGQINDLTQWRNVANQVMSKVDASGVVCSAFGIATNQPTTIALPAGQVADFRDTVTGDIKRWANDAGTIKEVGSGGGGGSSVDEDFVIAMAVAL